jgi:putative SOS response-associated peptidase YedK
MCGRYNLTTPVEGLRHLFEFPERPNLEPRYNIAPTQTAPIFRFDDTGAGHLLQLRWGLIPSWAKDKSIGARLINARGETVATQPAFRDAFRQRRCLVPADGFYEWRKEGKQKQPWHFHLADNLPFCFAGLWERWRDPETKTALESFTIITTDANELMAPIHNRMPVMLSKHDMAPWLEGSDAAKLLRPYPAKQMRAYPVSAVVNSWRNETPDCIAPAGEEKAAATSR